MTMFLCNELYRPLLTKEAAEHCRFHTDAQFRALSRPLPEIKGVIAQPYLLTRQLLDCLPNLRWVQVTAAGYDAADIEVLKERPVSLSNTRGVMSVSIAEDVMAKLLFRFRRIREIEAFRAEGTWATFDMNAWMCSCYTDLYGKSLGIIGFGSIGEEIAKRADAFGMRILTWGRHPISHPLVQESKTGPEGLSSLLAESDAVVLACPLTEDTFHLMDASAFRSMKSSAVLINIARGAIVDETALLSALQNGTIAAAACDVFETEPLPQSSPLWTQQNLFITPHKAGMGDTWQQNIGALISRNILHILKKEAPENLILLP